MPPRPLTRRAFCQRAAAGAAAAVAPAVSRAAQASFALRTNVASAMYGRLPLAEILPEVPKPGSEHIDIFVAIDIDSIS